MSRRTALESGRRRSSSTSRMDDDEVEVVLPWPGVNGDSTTRRPGVCSATTVRSSACPSLALEDHLLRAPNCPKHVVQHGRASTDVAVA